MKDYFTDGSSGVYCMCEELEASRIRVSKAHSASNQIKSLLLSHHHSTSALVSEILMSVLQTVQKNNRQFTYGQTVQKKQQTIYICTDSAKNCTGAFTVLQTVQKNNNSNLHMDRQCKKLHWSIYSAPDSAKKQQQQFTYGQTVQKNNSKWTVHHRTSG